ncbi:MAG: VWA domain-containing protein [Candidatus Poribacteria bacterium]|nr:VWA domain-containing protein [Candidatus Poribacteria bacterium]
MNRSYRRHRSMRALLFAGIVHLCLAITFMFSFYTPSQNRGEDALAVELINPEAFREQRRALKPPPPKKLRTPQQTDPSTDTNQRHLDLIASANLIDETMRQSEEALLHSATRSTSDIETTLPDATTDAERINSRETPISGEVASPFQTAAGAGVDSLRQRVKGDGGGGFHRLQSTGASEIGTIGDGDGDNEGEGTGKGNSNPFAKALKRIADHIIGTREVDKVNVVFVIDTSASMRDNIQEVAANLFAMTDEFDLVNLEYHLGMSEFSVRYEGQKLEIRTLLPDVGMLRRRMQKAKLSGDEHALDALLDTPYRIDFHADADQYIILVTDEPASTHMRKDGAYETMREKVIKEYQLQGIRVNVLGVPEPFQQKLAETTGGLWQPIPGGFGKVTTLPSDRVANEAFMKVFRDIVKDIRRNGGRLLFSMESQFEVLLEDGDVPIKKLQREFKKNGVSIAGVDNLFGSSMVWEKQKGDLWVITDYTNGRIYTIRKQGDKLNVFAGIYPESWNLSNSLTAMTQKRGNRWLINDSTRRRMYTIRNENDRLNIYDGAALSASPDSAVRGFEPVVDIVVMLDYSRSMGGKSEAIMLGLSTLIGRLDILPIKYRIGLIRFAEAKDAIKIINGAVVTQMPLNESMLESSMEAPFGGDEHLIDAIVEGVPKVKFSPYASRFLLILTDEPTTGKYPPERALRLCQSSGIRAYVIGHPGPTDFQKKLAEQTGGRFFTMPKHLNRTYPNQ